MTGVLVVEMLVREFMVIGDKSITDKFYSARVIMGLLVVIFAYASFAFNFSSSSMSYKRVFAAIFFARVGMRLVEFFYYHLAKGDYLRSYQIAYESLELSLMEGLMLVISGLYYLRENLVFGAINFAACAIMIFLTLGSEIPIALMRILFVTFYNLVDLTFDNMCEIEHFTNVSKVERKSLHLN